MKILVTGSKGQMGRDFHDISGDYPEHQFLFTDIEELDITQKQPVETYIEKHRPECIINCAAYTSVDKAEKEPESANLINGDATGILAEAASRFGSGMIHISTDYVFNGKSHRPYLETDATNPISVYAKSKYRGELAMHQYCKRGYIIRTSWLYSCYGNNFVRTMRKYGTERDEIKVVFDQIGCPTWSRDLCMAILRIIPAMKDLTGIETYHYSNEGICSWYDFAKAILEFSGIACRVKPIETKEYPLPARRPLYSVFNKHKIKARFDLEIPYWRDSLKACIDMLEITDKTTL